MEKSKEFIKTVILIILIISSLSLTYLISSYKPDYDILGSSRDYQEEQDREKILNNALNLLSPYIIVRNETNAREENALSTAITKVANVDAVKDKSKINEIIKEISQSHVDVSRIRNKSVNEIITKSNRYYTMKYKTYVDAISTQILYSGVDNQTTSLDFDTVLLVDSTKNTLYLCKNGTDNYMQIVFTDNIYDKVEKIFNKHSQTYGKYIIAGAREFYIKDSISDYTIDEYNVYNVEVVNISNDIFSSDNGLKVSSLDSGIREITDGYSILREMNDSILYINPSNMNVDKTILKISEIQSKSSNFLVQGYVPNAYYSAIEFLDNSIKYQEVYKDSFAFSSDLESSIDVKVTKYGVGQAKLPRVMRDALVSSEDMPMYHLENINALLNYLYVNLDINSLLDIELAYTKTYKNNKVTYSPTWYISYKSSYYSFEQLQEKVQKGEL